MAISRQEIRRNRQRVQRNKNLKLVGLIIISAVVAAFIIFSLLGKPSDIKSDNTGKVTLGSIENHVPKNSDAVFVSENNTEAWDYMKTISNAKFGEVINSAKYVGVSFHDGHVSFYAAGNASEMNKEVEKRKLGDFENLDGVYILSDEKNGLVENGLGTTENYKGKELESNNVVSRGYITNKNFTNYFKGDSGIPQEKFEWAGTFTEGAWVGDVEAISADDFKLEKLVDWVTFEKKPNWITNAFTKDSEDTVGILLTPKQLHEIIGGKEYSMGIDDIKVTIDAEGVMELSFGKN